MTTVQVENISDVKKKVTFEVPQERVVEMIDAQYRDLKKTAQIRGFRRGKVPLSILKSYFKDQVQADATRKIIEETFEPGLEENKITVVSVIKIEPESVAEDKPFKYIAEIEVAPQVELKEYKGLELTKYLREVTDERVNERLENLRERHAKLSPLTEKRGAREGDYLVVSIKAAVEGQPISELTVTDYHLELGRNFYLPGFDAELEGMTVGETKSVTMDLPENFPRRNLAGETADFEVTVLEAKERIFPELDDDFAKDLGEYETLEQLKATIREDLERVAENETRRDIENQIIEALNERHTLEVPESMVQNQIETILGESRRNLASMGLDPNRLGPVTQDQRDQIRPSAEKTVKAALILKAISEKEGIEITDETLQAEIERRAGEMGYSPDAFRDLLEEHDMVKEIRSNLLQQKVFDLLKEHARMTEVEGPPPEASQHGESGKE